MSTPMHSLGYPSRSSSGWGNLIRNIGRGGLKPARKGNPMQDFSSLLIGGVPLIAVIFGLVEFLKVFGLKDRILTICSLLLGLALGIAYNLTLGLPVDYAGWMAVIFFGLAIGLTTSGIYDFLNVRFPKLKS